MSTLTATRHCQLCDCDRFETVGDRDRHGHELRTEVCCRCGLVSHATIPTDAELAEYYAHEYRRDYNGEETPSARRVVREWERGRERYLIAKPFLKPGGRVFEIGAGIGCNLKHFELAGHEASGIEPGEGFCKYSREHLHCHVRPGFWSDLPPSPEYDFVLLIHVLEHFNAPLAALRHIRQMLRPEGRLMVEVPNLAAPHAAPGKQFHYAHIFNFTPWTLAAAARATGFEVLHASAEHDHNLLMILGPAKAARLEVEPDSYLRTRLALRRYGPLTYHLRPEYLLRRVGHLVRSFAENLSAERRIQAILSQVN